MKIFFLLFVLSTALLTGCSTNYNYPSKKITVHKVSGAESDYGLLSVRGDSAITVLDWAEASITPIPFSHVELIKRDSIARITRSGHGGGGENTGIGAEYGAAGGAIGGLIFGLWFEQTFQGFGLSTNRSSALPFYSVMIVIGAGAGALIGAFIGNAIPPSKELLLTSDSDRVFLRSISLYPDKEPDEMQYIK